MPSLLDTICLFSSKKQLQNLKYQKERKNLFTAGFPQGCPHSTARGDAISSNPLPGGPRARTSGKHTFSFPAELSYLYPSEHTMSKSDSLNLSVGSVNVESGTSRKVEVQLEDVDVSEVLDQISVADVVNFYSVKEILDQISIDDVVKHFGEDELFEALNIDPDFRN